MNGELLRRELDIEENPTTIKIIFNGKLDQDTTQSIFQLIQPRQIERNSENEKSTLVLTRPTDSDLTPQAKDFLQELHRQGHEILFT